MLTLLSVAEMSTVPRERVLIVSTVFIFSWCRSAFTTRDHSQWMQFPYEVYPYQLPLKRLSSVAAQTYSLC